MQTILTKNTILDCRRIGELGTLDCTIIVLEHKTVTIVLLTNDPHSGCRTSARFFRMVFTDEVCLSQNIHTNDPFCMLLSATWYEFDCSDYTIGESSGMVTVTILRKGDIRTAGHVCKSVWIVWSFYKLYFNEIWLAISLLHTLFDRNVAAVFTNIFYYKTY